MQPIPREIVKTIATLVPGIIGSLVPNRRRIPKDVVISAISSTLFESGYKGAVLKLVEKRLSEEFKKPFGDVKSYPKNKLGEEIHHVLNFIHLAPFPKTFIFVNNLTDEIVFKEIELNTTLTAEEIQDMIPTKVTQEKFENLMRGTPNHFTMRWYKTLYTPTGRVTQFEKIYASKKSTNDK